MISVKYAMRHSVTATWTFLPAPDQGVGRPRVRVGGTRTSLGGQQTLQTIAQFYTFTLGFTLLSSTEWGILETFRDLQGPHLFTDDNKVTSFNVSVVSLDESRVVNGLRSGTLTLQEAF